MLTKLLKYEAKATARTFFPLYCGVIILAVITRMLSGLHGVSFSGSSVSSTSVDPGWFMNLIFGVTIFLYGMFIVTMFAMTVIIAIQRFYKNLMGDEGYLMFTLPTPAWMLTTSKMLVTAGWILATTLITFLSVIILAAGERMWESFAQFPALWARFASEAGVSVAVLNLEVLLVVLVGFFSGIVPIYFAITWGAHIWPKHRILGAFGAYVIYNVATQILTGIVVFTYLNLLNATTTGMTNPQGHAFFLFLMVFSTLIHATLFYCTNWLLKHKLNLE